MQLGREGQHHSDPAGLGVDVVDGRHDAASRRIGADAGHDTSGRISSNWTGHNRPAAGDIQLTCQRCESGCS